MTSQFLVQRMVGAAVIVIVSLILGGMLADNSIMALAIVAGTAWALTLPWHHRLSVYVSIAFATSAFVLPFAPGRPYVWEFGALLGWSGAILTLVMRKEPADMWGVVRKNWLVYAGLIGYCIVLGVTMFYRGFGLAVFGSDQIGGRFYLQQFITAIYPILLCSIAISESTISRLFLLQCLLTITFLVSDLALSGVAGAGYLYIFFELSTDAINFERQAEAFGIKRYQSLGWVCMGMVTFLWARFGLRKHLTREAVFLIPASLVLLGLGLLSGHRYLFVILILSFIVCGYAQRLFTPRNVMIISGMLIVGLSFIYAAPHSLPLAAQRSVSFLPGIDASVVAKADAEGTWALRKDLVRIGARMAPSYLWMGRGLGFAGSGRDYFEFQGDQLTAHLNRGRFYNGLIGLLVNTGLFGTVFMMLFIIGGVTVASRVIGRIRKNKWEDTFALVSTVIASFFLAKTVGWLFLHGDSEWALRNFSLPVAMLIVCDNLLSKRNTAAAAARVESSSPDPAAG